MPLVLSAAVVLMMFVGVPLWMLLSLRTKTFGQFVYGRSGKQRSSSGIGNALQELDRLVARPAIEYRIEAEDRVNQLEDEHGGE